jgi:hypothetical protein
MPGSYQLPFREIDVNFTSFQRELPQTGEESVNALGIILPDN